MWRDLPGGALLLALYSPPGHWAGGLGAAGCVLCGGEAGSGARAPSSYVRQVGRCPLHCQVPSLAGRSHRVHPRDREGAGPSSSRGHQQPYLRGGKATFLCHASHRARTTCPPCWRDRDGSKFGSCSSFCCMSVLVLSLGCSTTGAHEIRTRVSLPHPRAKSPCHCLTVGRPPTWHLACTVTRDTRGILTHRDRA